MFLILLIVIVLSHSAEEFSKKIPRSQGRRDNPGLQPHDQSAAIPLKPHNFVKTLNFPQFSNKSSYSVVILD